MNTLVPRSAEELARLLQQASSESNTIAISGNSSKRLMAGPISPADVIISTSGLRRILQYERDDLTVSVEAGMPFGELQALLARNGQMIALDPPFAAQATIGGVIASNSNGPLRRAFGTARDLVIGMTFATLEGKLVKTGGMVVKNVAGLDMGKLMIGSFGTLAVMTSINFRVHSLPRETRTFLYTFGDVDAAVEKRNYVIRSVLQPLSVDLITPPAAARIGQRGYVLAIRAGGSPAVLDRYARELAGSDVLTAQREMAFWQTIREFSPEFLRRQPGGIVLRISTTLDAIHVLLKLVSGTCIARAASGVTYVYLSSWQGVPMIWQAALEHAWPAVIEYAPDELRNSKELWLDRQGDGAENAFDMMKKIKHMFDPQNLLNRSRLYGRI